MDERTDVFSDALNGYLTMQEHRVKAMYNRTRAVFAEFIVAAALPEAVVVEDPAAAWDIDWPVDGRDARLEVKCSGERLPRFPDGRSAPSWVIPTRRKGYDPHRRVQLGVDHHCDAIVLARHEGPDISTGWSFRVVVPGELPEGRKISGRNLEKRGIASVSLDKLERALRDLLATPDR